MERTPILLCLFTLLIEVSQCVEIIDISVPDVIRNNTRASIVLDCEFRYEEYEVDGLEVKWFWNGEPEPVYQWLPGEKPEALSILKGRVNLRHRASKDRNSVHRAVEILEPTTDLTGTYMCRVSSFHDEDSASRKMIVYAPARSMNLTFVKIKRRAVNFFCAAVGTFPEPRLRLLLMKENKIRVIKPRRIETTKDALGAFDIFLEATVRDKTLPKEALIQCVLEIPNTGYRMRRQVVYFPDYTYRGYDVGSSPVLPCSLIPLSTILLYPSQYLIFMYI